MSIELIPVPPSILQLSFRPLLLSLGPGARPALLFAHRGGAEDAGVMILCNKLAVFMRPWSNGMTVAFQALYPLSSPCGRICVL